MEVGSNLNVELYGTTAGSQYDQLVVTGTVDLGGATLNISRSFVPANGTEFILIDNDGTDPIVGTFAGLAEGALVTLDGRDFQLSYAGGVGGNDVVHGGLNDDLVAFNVR